MQQDNAGHILPSEKKSYNERLFKKGIRKYFHEARFFWFRKTLKKLGVTSGGLLELGCYDGKLLNYLPFKPVEYDGYDANWEQGLDLARVAWKDEPSVHFHFCNTPADLNPQLKKYELVVSMETLEHLPPADMPAYLSRIKASASRYLFVTVPNEKGPVFLLKYGIKKLFLKVDEPYTSRELFFATFGKLNEVKRNVYGHKGFNYPDLVSLIATEFRVISVQPIPFSFLPFWMNFSVGIVAEAK